MNNPSHSEDQLGSQKSSRLEIRVTVDMGYLLYHPRDYDTKETWPLLLFLHGAGERGDDLELVTKHGPPRLIKEGKDFSFVVVSPQCKADRWWEPIELSALLDEVIKNNKIDTNRIYVTGLSMGGFGTWRLAAYSPNRFAAIAPICGGGEAVFVRHFRHIPVWAFHGAKDEVVPLECTTDMTEALERVGAKPKLTIYPEAAHDSWTETYNNAALYDWLLQHKRVERQEK